MPSDLRSGAVSLASASAAERTAFLKSLTEDELRALPYLFEFWALPHQLPPEGDWRTWLIMGGRGAGKTRAGAEWVRSMVEGPRRLAPGRARRVALMGETYDQTREVMVFGESGILACSPPDRRPEWIASRKMLIWPNGAVATLHSATEYEGLRGPQFDAAWVDEIAKWKTGSKPWDMLAFALRLGDDPRVCATTTPRSTALMKSLTARASTVMTQAPTEANRANLADSFLVEVREMFKGNALAKQELDGVLLDGIDGALWTWPMLDAARGPAPEAFTRIVVAVDPPATGRKTSDACGIVVAGVVAEGPAESWRAYVLEDASVEAASPAEWAMAAVAAYHRHGAGCLLAETNQGGSMVEAVIRQIDPMVAYKGVHASRSKSLRAEPVAALYQRARVTHVEVFEALEDEMVQMTPHGFEGGGSPDRTDALVWALSELMLAPRGAPQVRSLLR